MKVILEHKESEKFFHTALCNGGSIGEYGLSVTYEDIDYKKAKKSIADKLEKGEVPHFMHQHEFEKKQGKMPTICFEDVLIELLLMGKKITLVDSQNGEDDRVIGIKEVHDRVEKTEMHHLIEYINDTGGDATTAEVVLQTVFFGEVIFG